MVRHLPSIETTGVQNSAIALMVTDLCRVCEWVVLEQKKKVIDEKPQNKTLRKKKRNAGRNTTYIPMVVVIPTKTNCLNHASIELYD